MNLANTAADGRHSVKECWALIFYVSVFMLNRWGSHPCRTLEAQTDSLFFKILSGSLKHETSFQRFSPRPLCGKLKRPHKNTKTDIFHFKLKPFQNIVNLHSQLCFMGLSRKQFYRFWPIYFLRHKQFVFGVCRRGCNSLKGKIFKWLK